jgi:2,3-bisphosphoglycerate-independent phosphoglycerate mutase
LNDQSALGPARRRVLTVVMDGIGLRQEIFGNAVAWAHTPNLHYLHNHALTTALHAHGTAVGLPSDQDIGNSEVGHNALGAGRTFDQGAKLVDNAIATGSLFAGEVWRDLVAYVKANHGTLHFIGLLSDGNVHSHEKHLYAMLRHAASVEKVEQIRVHALLDGRDVAPASAERYIAHLEEVLAELRALGCDAKVASGGGRMMITMDRYQADWNMVAAGWKVHVKADGPMFPSLGAAVAHYRAAGIVSDQDLPGFVVGEAGKPNGPIGNGDAVILCNFRGDRAIELSRALTEEPFTAFARGPLPAMKFAGMMEYDGDLHIPPRFLVSPPLIRHTLGERLVDLGCRQFACSETQKFGHVTYFWNGNRSGYFSEKLEEYVEIQSDIGGFDLKPWMKAAEITDATVERMLRHRFAFGRLNFANGDMVGHTGNFHAAVVAVSAVDLMLGRLITAAQASDTILVVTADHGNCDEMFDAKATDFPDWQAKCRSTPEAEPKPKTSHTLAPVPFYIYDPRGDVSRQYLINQSITGTLANVANTSLVLMGLPTVAEYEPSLISSRQA